MKVILTEDVPRIGKKYDIKDVPQGFAQNFLLKNKKAVVATPEAIREIEQKKESVRLTRDMERTKLKENLARLKDVRITLKATANEKGHLFKSIHPKDIVKELASSGSVAITEEMLDLDAPIKEVGEHAIPVIWEGERGSFTLVVEAL